MPNRVIKESIKRSEQIDSLTWFEEVVFYRLIVTADDYGCLDGRTVLLKNELFPSRDDVTKKAVSDAIRKLTSVGLLCEYTVSGKPYLFFPTWEKHQRVRNKHRKFPAPPDDMDLTANCCQMTADCQPESNPIRIQSKYKGRFGPVCPVCPNCCLSQRKSGDQVQVCLQSDAGSYQRQTERGLHGGGFQGCDRQKVRRMAQRPEDAAVSQAGNAVRDKIRGVSQCPGREQGWKVWERS